MKKPSDCAVTFQELLARILLEERFMDDRAGEVVNHEFEQGFDLFLIVPSIMSKCSVLFCLVIFSF